MGVADGEEGRSVRKVVLALRDDLVKPAFLERSGGCTSHGEEGRDNKTYRLESRHVVCWKSLRVYVTNIACVHASRNEVGC